MPHTHSMHHKCTAPPPPLGKVLHLPGQTTYPLVGGGDYPFPMHFYRVLKGFLMVVGGFWRFVKVFWKVAVTACKQRKLYFPKYTVFHLISMHKMVVFDPSIFL